MWHRCWKINWVKLRHVDEYGGIAKGSDQVCVITAQDQRGIRGFSYIKTELFLPQTLKKTSDEFLLQSEKKILPLAQALQQT